jgi:hypothetical protein
MAENSGSVSSSFLDLLQATSQIGTSEIATGVGSSSSSIYYEAQQDQHQAGHEGYAGGEEEEYDYYQGEYGYDDEDADATYHDEDGYYDEEVYHEGYGEEPGDGEGYDDEQMPADIG